MEGSSGSCLAHMCLWPFSLVAYFSRPQDPEERYSSQDPVLSCKLSGLGGHQAATCVPPQGLARSCPPRGGSPRTAKMEPGGQGHIEDLGRGDAL